MSGATVSVSVVFMLSNVYICTNLSFFLSNSFIVRAIFSLFISLFTYQRFFSPFINPSCASSILNQYTLTPSHPLITCHSPHYSLSLFPLPLLILTHAATYNVHPTLRPLTPCVSPHTLSISPSDLSPLVSHHTHTHPATVSSPPTPPRGGHASQRHTQHSTGHNTSWWG